MQRQRSLNQGAWLWQRHYIGKLSDALTRKETRPQGWSSTLSLFSSHSLCGAWELWSLLSIPLCQCICLLQSHFSGLREREGERLDLESQNDKSSCAKLAGWRSSPVINKAIVYVCVFLKLFLPAEKETEPGSTAVHSKKPLTSTVEDKVQENKPLPFRLNNQQSKKWWTLCTIILTYYLLKPNHIKIWVFLFYYFTLLQITIIK